VKFQLILMLLLAVAIFSADSLNVRLDFQIPTAPLRGITAGGDIIIAFGKSPTAYAVQGLCGGSAVILDSISWSGSTLPTGTDLAGRWISAQDNIAYLADWTRGLRIIDFYEPWALTDLGGMTLGGQCRSALPRGDRLYVGAGSGGVHVIDISTPSAASLLANYEIGGTVLDVVAPHTTTLFVADHPVGVSVWDLASPTSPTNFISLTGTISGIESTDIDSIFIATNFDGQVHFLRYSSEGALSILNTLNLGALTFKTAYQGGMIAIAAGRAGLYVYRLAPDGYSVVDSGYYAPDVCTFVDVCISGEKAVVADANGAIWFFDLSFFYGNIAESTPLPDRISISAYPNPFNSAVRITIDGVRAGLAPPRVEIFDISGRRMASLQSFGGDGGSLDIGETTGLHQFIWTPSEEVSSGIFFARVAEQDAISKKIIYMK